MLADLGLEAGVGDAGLEAGGRRGHGGPAGPVLRPREEAAAAVPEPHQPPLPGQVHQHQPGAPQGQHLLLSRRVDLVPGATALSLYILRNSFNFLLLVHAYHRI